MRIEAVFVDLQQIHGDIGAVVRDPLVIRRNVREDESRLDRALSLAETAHMAFLLLHVESVDDLLQRLHLSRQGQIVVLERQHSHVHDRTDRIAVDPHFVLRLL